MIAYRGGLSRSPVSTADDTLVKAVLHLVGQSRAFVHQVEAGLAELNSLHDERAERLAEAIELTLALPARPGSLRHLEEAGTALLRSLREPGGPAA